MKTAAKKRTRKTLRFPRQPVTAETVMGKSLAWLSRCGGYRIMRFPEFECGVQRFYVAIARLETSGGLDRLVWRRLENHPSPCRRLRSAIAACAAHARHQQ
jgi:hypothetical protein